MNIATITKIKSVKINLELGIELELDNLLKKELEAGLSSDINYCV